MQSAHTWNHLFSFRTAPSWDETASSTLKQHLLHFHCTDDFCSWLESFLNKVFCFQSAVFVPWIKMMKIKIIYLFREAELLLFYLLVKVEKTRTS